MYVCIYRAYSKALVCGAVPVIVPLVRGHQGTPVGGDPLGSQEKPARSHHRCGQILYVCMYVCILFGLGFECFGIYANQSNTYIYTYILSRIRQYSTHIHTYILCMHTYIQVVFLNNKYLCVLGSVRTSQPTTSNLRKLLHTQCLAEPSVCQWHKTAHSCSGVSYALYVYMYVWTCHYVCMYICM